jgi:hypothetical protein
MVYGMPIYHPNYTWMQRFFTGQTGARIPNTDIAGPLTTTRAYTLLDGSNGDWWSNSLRYMLTVPLVRKISLLGTMDVVNPFNHRGRSQAQPPTFTTAQTRPYALTTGAVNPDGSLATLAPQFPYGGNSNDISTYANIAPGDYNGLYTGRMGGRVITFQTGLRF